MEYVFWGASYVFAVAVGGFLHYRFGNSVHAGLLHEFDKAAEVIKKL
jgi:hypothetical protein